MSDPNRLRRGQTVVFRLHDELKSGVLTLGPVGLHQRWLVVGPHGERWRVPSVLIVALPN